MKALALVCAEWWLSPRLETLTWMPRAIDPGIISAGGQYRRMWDRFVELFGDRLPDGAVALGSRVGPSSEVVQTDLFEWAPTMLCHGDFRADNLMFDDSATGREHVGILDWQITYRSGGIGDVCYLTTQSMTVEDRRAQERGLVDIWFDSVCSALGAAPDGYTAESTWDDYRSMTGNMTVYGVLACGGMDPSSERGLELVTDMAARSFVAALDLDAASFIPGPAPGAVAVGGSVKLTLRIRVIVVARLHTRDPRLRLSRQPVETAAVDPSEPACARTTGRAPRSGGVSRLILGVSRRC